MIKISTPAPVARKGDREAHAPAKWVGSDFRPLIFDQAEIYEKIFAGFS
jgi:hypothetical protein